MRIHSRRKLADNAPTGAFCGAVAFLDAKTPSGAHLVRVRTVAGAQRVCCAGEPGAQRYSGPWESAKCCAPCRGAQRTCCARSREMAKMKRAGRRHPATCGKMPKGELVGNDLTLRVPGETALVPRQRSRYHSGFHIAKIREILPFLQSTRGPYSSRLATKYRTQR